VATPTNPIDTAAFFVRQHYLDFLNREPDQAGSFIAEPALKVAARVLAEDQATSLNIGLILKWS
jgi:hypothetical protein